MAAVAPTSPSGDKRVTLDPNAFDDGRPMPAWQEQWRAAQASRPMQHSLSQTMNQSMRLLSKPTPSSHRNSILEVIKPQLLEDQEDEHPLPRARMPFTTFLFTTVEGQVLILALSAFCLIAAGAFTWWMVEGYEHMDGVDGDSFWDIWKACVWMSWGLFFDPGTQTGVSSSAPSQILYTAMGYSIIGFLWMLSTFGTIVEGVRSYLQRCEKEYSQVVATGHMLILGWSDKTPFLLEEMFEEALNRGKKLKKVVILAEFDAIEMRQTLVNHLSHSHLGDKVVRRVCCRSGDMSDPVQLQKVSAHSARDIIVLAPDGSPREADMKVIRVVLALAAVPETLGGRVLVEVRCADTAPILESLLPSLSGEVSGRSRIEGIHSRVSVNRMLCLMAKKPVVGDCLVYLSSFADGEELYLVTPPPCLRGQIFAKACTYFRNALCIGMKPGDGQKGEIVLAPPDDQVIKANDKLLLIAMSQATIDEEHRRRHSISLDEEEIDPAQLQAQAKRRSCCLPWRNSRRGGLPSMEKTRSSLSHLAAATKKLLITGEAEVAEGAPPTVRGYFGASGESSVFIVIGYGDDFWDLMQSMDFYVRPGSKIHVLSERPTAMRKTAIGTKMAQMENLEIVHHEGCRTSVDKLSSLPLSEAHAILILAEGGCETSASDSACIAAAVMICGICQGKYGQQRLCKLKGRIICEILSPQTDFIISRNAELRSKVVFFRSNALETGLFAMASSEPMVFNTLVLLISPSHASGKIISVELRQYLCNSEEETAVETCGASLRFSFWEIYLRVRAGGDILIGWHRLEDSRTKLGTNIDREELVQWHPGDFLVVVKRPKEGEVASVLKRKAGQPEIVPPALERGRSPQTSLSGRESRKSPSPAPMQRGRSPQSPPQDKGQLRIPGEPEPSSPGLEAVGSATPAKDKNEQSLPGTSSQLSDARTEEPELCD
mmetsp:Transcript_6039/g.13334  ORF Transcript_6039/g.13334 Transcript_6039/m.13334 type:complete len:942 (-) Transcript_6039:173-2998(-)